VEVEEEAGEAENFPATAAFNEAHVVVTFGTIRRVSSIIFKTDLLNAGKFFFIFRPQ